MQRAWATALLPVPGTAWLLAATRGWYNRLCVCCRYEGHDRWATNGSINLKHFLQLDTGQGSLEDQAAAVLQFLTRRNLM